MVRCCIIKYARMRSVVFCYAAPDLDLAREIGAYLEMNLPVACSYEEGLIGPRRDLLDAVGRGLSAELAFVLLSPESIPRKWVRTVWEPVLMDQPRELGSQLVFGLARACKFPDLLRRQSFCDFTQNRLEALRAAKRLVLAHRRPVRKSVDLPAPGAPVSLETPVLEQLHASLADRPGQAQLPRDIALAFAHSIAPEFEGVFWIDCALRTPAGVLGDVSQALQLRLSGSLEQNRRALEDFCRERRILFLFEHAAGLDPRWTTLGGLASVIRTADSRLPEPAPIEEALALFPSWPMHEARCLSLLGDAYYRLQSLDPLSDPQWRATTQLGSAMLGLLKHFDRLAEANEILEIFLKGARVRADQDALSRFQWEQSWILGHWGEPYSDSVIQPPNPRDSVQLGFDFA